MKPALDPTSLTQVQPKPEKAIVCRACGHVVTHKRFQHEINGAHEHTFRNPAAYSFHLVCYSEAPGCVVEGPATTDATWFAGYAWSFALCGGCQQHLGWWYAGRNGSFAGLIATRLVREG